MLRRITLSAFVVLGSVSLLLAQSQSRQPPPPTGRSTTELIVRVTYEDDRSVGEQVRVQVTNASGVPVADAFTRSEGEARFPDMEPGSYRLRVTGLDIDEKVSDYSFMIHPRQLNHMEFIRVRRKPDKDAQSSTQGSISAAALNVPPKAEAEYEKGLKALRKQDPGEAQRRFARALVLYPRYAAALNNMGVIAMQQGKKEEGRELFLQAIKADEQYAPPYLNMAKIVVAKQNYAEAEELLHRATTLDPTNVEIIAILAMIEFESNKYPLALANARKVHGLPAHERFAFAHYIVGRVLETQNQPREAVVEYRLFLKEAPASPSAESVRRLIAGLEQKQ